MKSLVQIASGIEAKILIGHFCPIRLERIARPDDGRRKGRPDENPLI